MSLDLRSLGTSFDLVAPRGDELVDAFYARLFAASGEFSSGPVSPAHRAVCELTRLNDPGGAG